MAHILQWHRSCLTDNTQSSEVNMHKRIISLSRGKKNVPLYFIQKIIWEKQNSLLFLVVSWRKKKKNLSGFCSIFFYFSWCALGNACSVGKNRYVKDAWLQQSNISHLSLTLVNQTEFHKHLSCIALGLPFN